jgi:hypothetical protein
MTGGRSKKTSVSSNRGPGEQALLDLQTVVDNNVPVNKDGGRPMISRNDTTESDLHQYVTTGSPDLQTGTKDPDQTLTFDEDGDHPELPGENSGSGGGAAGLTFEVFNPPGEEKVVFPETKESAAAGRKLSESSGAAVEQEVRSKPPRKSRVINKAKKFIKSRSVRLRHYSSGASSTEVKKHKKTSKKSGKTSSSSAAAIPVPPVLPPKRTRLLTESSKSEYDELENNLTKNLTRQKRLSQEDKELSEENYDEFDLMTEMAVDIRRRTLSGNHSGPQLMAPGYHRSVSECLPGRETTVTTGSACSHTGSEEDKSGYTHRQRQKVMFAAKQRRHIHGESI